MFSKEFGAKAGATVSDKHQIQLKNRYLLPRKFRGSHRKGQHKRFPVNVAKFLRTPILKNISERLLLKISTSAANLPKGGNCPVPLLVLLSF